MIFLLNASLIYWRQSYKQLTPHSESGTCRRIYKMIDLRIGTIVMEDPSGDTKSVDDMMSDKVNHVGGFNFNERIASANFEK